MTPEAADRTIAEILELDEDSPEVVQYLVDRPAVVESFLLGTDWSAPQLAEVHRLLRTIFQGQQEALALGARLAITVNDASGAHTYTADL